MLTVSFFILCKYDIKPSTSLEEANHPEFFKTLSIQNCGLREAVIEHLIKSGKSSRMFLNSVWRPDGHLMERLLYRGDHSDEDKLRLLISWFDSSIQRQPREKFTGMLSSSYKEKHMTYYYVSSRIYTFKWDLNSPL